MLEETIKELEQRLELLEHKRANLKNEIATTEREMAEIKNSLSSLRRLANLSIAAQTLQEISNAAATRIGRKATLETRANMTNMRLGKKRGTYKK